MADEDISNQNTAINRANFHGSVVAADYQFAIFPDKDHRSLTIMQDFARNVPAMHAAGAQVFIFEIHEGNQKVFDDLKTGYVDEEVLRENADLFSTDWMTTHEDRMAYGNTVLDIILYAHRHDDVEVHFLGKLPSVIYEQPEMTRHMQRMMGLGLHARAYEDEHLSGEDKEIFREFIETFIEQRYGDLALKDRAERFEQAAAGRKTVIHWGGNHFDNVMNDDADIDEYLKGTSIRAESYESRNHMESLDEQGYVGEDEPAIRRFIDTGEIEITEKGGEIGLIITHEPLREAIPVLTPDPGTTSPAG